MLQRVAGDGRELQLIDAIWLETVEFSTSQRKGLGHTTMQSAPEDSKTLRPIALSAGG